MSGQVIFPDQFRDEPVGGKALALIELARHRFHVPDFFVVLPDTPEEEIAKAVRFLVESDFVTGETIRVDGGRHVK